MINCRFINSGPGRASFNMAADEFLMKKGETALRVYSWEPSAVSIGYFQKIMEEVDVEECKRQNIDIIRRITGGGAVFHNKELTYSFIIPIGSFISNDLYESYSQICGAVIEGISMLGIKSSFRPINDIIVDNRKISGNAQTRDNDVILQHGTILMDVDVERMFTLLKVREIKMRDKIIKDVKNYVTSIKNECNKNVTFNEIAQSILKGFERKFGMSLEWESLTENEIHTIKELERKYQSREWNFWR